MVPVVDSFFSIFFWQLIGAQAVAGQDRLLLADGDVTTSATPNGKTLINMNFKEVPDELVHLFLLS